MIKGILKALAPAADDLLGTLNITINVGGTHYYGCPRHSYAAHAHEEEE